MPTFVLIKNNEEVARVVGANAQELEQKIGQHVTTAPIQPTHNTASAEQRQFLEKFATYAKNMTIYEDELAQTMAISVMPVDAMKAESMVDGKLSELELLKQLVHWFKADFFKWTDTPSCEACGKVTKPDTTKVDGVPLIPTEEIFGRAPPARKEQQSHCVLNTPAGRALHRGVAHLCTRW